MMSIMRQAEHNKFSKYRVSEIRVAKVEFK
jgi:hypothetical protein